jgi:hypothetical protein
LWIGPGAKSFRALAWNVEWCEEQQVALKKSALRV